jgi:hypothetical protein
MYKLICILILVSLLMSTNEGYQNNKIPSDRPDDLQFYACHDYNPIEFEGQDIELHGNNNYKETNHSIGEPKQGVYSDFLNIYKLRNYNEIFHAPICENKYNFNTINSLHTPNLLMNDNDENILKVEEEFDKNNIKDPFYVYGNPNYIENKLLYSSEINELFLSNHDSQTNGQWTSRLNDIYD